VILYNLYTYTGIYKWPVDINCNIYSKYLCLKNWVLVHSFFSHTDCGKLQVTLMVVDHLAPPEGAENCHIVSWELLVVDCVWNVMAHAQKPDFVFRRNGRVLLFRRGRLFSRLLAAEVCASVVVMLDTPCSEEVWRVLATHSIRQFPLHFPSRASPCATTFQLDSTDRRTDGQQQGILLEGHQRAVTCSLPLFAL
jgi:hypothetical protein